MQTQFDQWYNNLHARGIDSFEHSLASQVSKASNESGGNNGNNSFRREGEEKAEGKDSDVNDDIMAFYQAKDELLKRRR